MSQENPYATPSTDPLPAHPVSGQLQLATPSERFGGAFIDGLINAVVIVPLMYLTGFMGTDASGHPAKTDFLHTAMFAAIGFAFFAAIQWKFLKATGQTIGKKVAKTRIVTMEGKKPEIGDLLGKRYLFMNFLGVIPVVGGVLALVNALFVFRKDRRCIHDQVAGTQVVKFPPGEIIS